MIAERCGSPLMQTHPSWLFTLPLRSSERYFSVAEKTDQSGDGDDQRLCGQRRYRQDLHEDGQEGQVDRDGKGVDADEREEVPYDAPGHVEHVPAVEHEGEEDRAGVGKDEAEEIAQPYVLEHVRDEQGVGAI